MKIGRGLILGVIVIIAIVVGFYFLMSYQKDKSNESFASRIADLGTRNPTESIESLQRSIDLYEKRIEQHVNDAAQVGIYWKILAIRFQDRNLHGEALKALEQAISYHPSDASLHYLTGISATIVAKATHDFDGTGNFERQRLYELAEDSFLRAIDMDNNYFRPLYSLGVLYTFDFDRAEDAIPYLQRALDISPNDEDAMFVLARAYFIVSSYRQAVEVYDRLIRIITDKRKLEEAQNNRQIVLGRLYG